MWWDFRVNGSGNGTLIAEPARRAARFAVLDSPIAGRGAFAMKPLAAGECLVEYIGQRISKEESARRCEDGNAFIFSLNDQWDLDGDVPDNPARFFNHSCDPNCEAVDDDGRIWIQTLRDIPAGEELTFNYGYDLADYRDHPCACGSPDCVGYIVAAEHFETVRRQESDAAPAGVSAV
jgi:SET domain-containing protein